MSNEKNKTKQKWNNGYIQHCIYSEKHSSLSFQFSKARAFSKCLMVFWAKMLSNTTSLKLPKWWKGVKENERREGGRLR